MREKRIQIDGKDTPYLVRDNGTVWSEKRNRELKGTVERNEYHTVYLMVNGHQHNLMVHRLVAEAFCENPFNYSIVHHIDGNKLNNRAENLQWVDSQTNAKEVKFRKPRGESQPASLLKEWIPLSFDKNYAVNKDGEVANLVSGKLLKGGERNGYMRVYINNTAYSVHRLVFEAFHGYCPKYIDHIDGDRANNKLENLREVTQSENMHNAMRNGHSGQIPVLQFDLEGNFIQEYPTIQAAADAVGRTHAAIRKAVVSGTKSAGFLWERKS